MEDIVGVVKRGAWGGGGAGVGEEVHWGLTCCYNFYTTMQSMTVFHL